MEQQNEREVRAPAPVSESPPPLRFTCPVCEVILQVSAELAGVCAPCPGCRTEIVAPQRRPWPQPLEIKPRRHRPPRKETAPASASAEQGIFPPNGPIPAMGAPLPQEGPSVSPFGIRSEAAPPPASSSDQTGRRRRVRSGSGRSVSPVTGFSDRYQNRKDTIVIVKILVAVLLTVGLALGVVFLTKKSFGSPPVDLPEEGSRQH